MEFFRFKEDAKAAFYQKILLEVGRLAPIMLIDAKGNFVFASDAFLKDMGLEPQDLLKKTAYDLVEEKFYDRSPSLKALAENKDCAELSYSRGNFPVYTETKILRSTDNSIQYVLCHSMKPDTIYKEMEVLRRQLVYYRGKLAEVESGKAGSQIIYQSVSMRETILAADRVARVDTAVLLTGESGVGKDLLARRIHEQSDRADKPIIPVCIPIMSPSLMESELFGYTEGAFTGSAKKGKAGLFEAADGGTVFLDEVGDIPLDLQVKLLRVLENQEIIRVGSTQRKRLNIRIIAATNKDIQSMVAQGTFREDLYYRLGVIQLHVPPLRDREGDVPLLAKFFLNHFNEKYNFRKTFSPAALQRLEDCNWPGNVRQLRNTVEQAVVLSNEPVITEQEVAHIIQNALTAPPVPAKKAGSSVVTEASQIERQQIVDALVKTNGNKKKAAELLGISRSKLYRRLESL